MTTLTGTPVAKPAVEVHAGLNGVFFEVTSTGTLAAADVILMGRVPDRARIVDGWFAVPTAANVVNVGLYRYEDEGTAVAIDADMFAAAASASAGTIQRFWTGISATANLAYQVSISQTNQERYALVAIGISSAVGDTSGNYQLYIQYYMDGEETT